MMQELKQFYEHQKHQKDPEEFDPPLKPKLGENTLAIVSKGKEPTTRVRPSAYFLGNQMKKAKQSRVDQILQ